MPARGISGSNRRLVIEYYDGVSGDLLTLNRFTPKEPECVLSVCLWL